MKSKSNKDLILFIILIPLFLGISFYLSSIMGNKLPNYTTSNKSSMGYSAFFETLKQLNYPVDITIKPVNSYDISSIQIVAQGGNFDVNSKEIKAWVEKGGILIYLTEGKLKFIDYGILPQVKGNVTLYKYDKGMVINADASYVTNSMLTKKTTGAYELLQEIDSHPYKKIYFNEGHVYSTIAKKSLWDYIPMSLKYIIYQFILVIIAFFYYKGKRFGKVLPFYEEIERTENEYLYSAASLYRQAKCSDLILSNYYKSFLRQMNKSHENWLEYWEEQKLPSVNNAKKVYEFMHIENRKLKGKDYLPIVTMLEGLSEILKKRREKQWKILKINQ